ncbi:MULTISPECIES: phage tail tape measure protein [Sphingobacterium]|uniref:Phage tail tape measure protein n=1 Tax=Sphingobacterium populi TaxID=1812824 RepID=A0ABW5U9D9_9SPHI|nr:phage tail tape measure protein [Sphingobacterium sp. CFCC 11742]
MARGRTDTESVLKLIIDNKQAKTAVNDLRDTYFKLNAELNKMKEADNPELYQRKVQELQKVKRAWDEQRDAIRGVNNQSKELSLNWKTLAKQAAAGLGFAALFQTVKSGLITAIQKNAELSDVMAGVQKTTGLSEEAVDRLNEKFKQMDTRTASNDLLGLAQIAGKLGYTASKDVEGFVRAADKIGVALGEDLGGVEDSVRSLGKLVDIFNIKDDYGLEEALMKVGSAINSLGASGSAAEKNLVDFTQRMAGIAPAAGISLADTLGLAATVDELGQSMESGATAIGQFIVGLGKDIPKNAKIAGMSTAEFAKLLNEDANEALIRVLEGARTAGGGLEALATNMGVLEISGARGIAALGALAENTEMLRRRQRLSNDEFKAGTSVLEEFNTVNNNLAANLDKIWNKLDQMWQSSGFRKWMTDITAAIIDNRSEFEKAMSTYQSTERQFNEMESSLTPLITRYEELKAKGTLNREEHIELRNIIKQLSEQWPIAVEEVDKYGNALSINTGILKNNILEHERYLSIVNKTAIAEGKAERDRLKAREKRLLAQAADIRKSGNISVYNENGDGRTSIRKATNDDILSINGQLEQVRNEIYVTEVDLDKLGANALRKSAEALSSVGTKKFMQDSDAIKKRIEELKDVMANPSTSTVVFEEASEWVDKLEKRLKTLEAKEGEGNKLIGKENKKPKTDAEREKEKQERIAKQTKEHYERMLKEEELFAAQQLINQMEKNDKEIKQLELSYKQKIDKFTEFLTREGVTAEQKANAIQKIEDLKTAKKKATDDLRVKHEEDAMKNILAFREQMIQKSLSEYDQERVRINKHYDSLLKDTGDNAEMKKQIEVSREIEITDAKIREEERLQEVKRQLEQDGENFSHMRREQRIASVVKHYDKEIKLLKEKNSSEIQESEAFKEVIAAYESNKQKEINEINYRYQDERKQMAVGIAQSISDATFSIISNNIAAESSARLSQMQKDRQRELENQNLTERQKKAINDKYDKLERAEKLRAWKAEQKASLLQAVISTALAVTRALPNIFLAAAAGAAGAAQVAVIASQKAPQFEKGGILPQGSQHSQGGINLVDSRGGNILGNIEGGEPILSRNTYANNREVVDTLLYSSQRKNGARIHIGTTALESERYRRSSAMTTSAPVVQVSAPRTDNSDVVAILQQILEKDDSNRQIVISNRVFQDHQEEIDRITNRVNA